MFFPTHLLLPLLLLPHINANPIANPASVIRKSNLLSPRGNPYCPAFNCANNAAICAQNGCGPCAPGIDPNTNIRGEFCTFGSSTQVTSEADPGPTNDPTGNGHAGNGNGNAAGSSSSESGNSNAAEAGSSQELPSSGDESQGSGSSGGTTRTSNSGSCPHNGGSQGSAECPGQKQPSYSGLTSCVLGSFLTFGLSHCGGK